ncbi:hypothetical protein L484_025611 [Morus notabilis]|uniref:Uncharacterized protein n=1 Tax=Morus notabilis TaxID=981085 RepID=W9RXJ3_9ROSA|nr:hypothetical protein L484_025611 [Morus notabilis]
MSCIIYSPRNPIDCGLPVEQACQPNILQNRANVPMNTFRQLDLLHHLVINFHCEVLKVVSLAFKRASRKDRNLRVFRFVVLTFADQHHWISLKEFRAKTLITPTSLSNVASMFSLVHPGRGALYSDRASLAKCGLRRATFAPIKFMEMALIDSFERGEEPS